MPAESARGTCTLFTADVDKNKIPQFELLEQNSSSIEEQWVKVAL